MKRLPRSRLPGTLLFLLYTLSAGCGAGSGTDGDTASDGDCTWDQWNPGDGGCDGDQVERDEVVSGSCRMVLNEFDPSCAGKNDCGFESICWELQGTKETYTYDQSGNLIHEEVTVGHMLWDQYCTSYTYNSRGNVLKRQVDIGCDGFGPGDGDYPYGSVDTCYAYSYDCQGNISRENEDRDCNCRFDTCRFTIYDDDGNLLSSGSDAGCDGVPDSHCFAFTCDERGNRLTTNGDRACDGTTSDDQCSIYTYDERGNMLTDVYDEGCDGIDDRRHTYTYDERGNRLTEVVDCGKDLPAHLCRFSVCGTWSYDDRGHTLTYTYDESCNGPSSEDYCKTVTYDEQGNILSEVEDDDCDGQSPGDNCMAYTYDDRGNKLSAVYDEGCDGKNLREDAWHYIYDDQDRLLMSIARVFYCYFTTYDRHGNAISSINSEYCNHTEWGCGTMRYQCLDGDTWTDSATGSDGDTETEPDGDCSGPCVSPEVQQQCHDGWCRIPAGCFTMPHEVRLTHSFEIMETEISQGRFHALMGYNRSSCVHENSPVDRVSWHEALKAANALSASEGYEECFDCNSTPYPGLHCRLKARYARPQECPGYRLPTEAEWRHAADGWGVQHDLSGPVSEWVWDWYGDYPQQCVTDPVGPASGRYRVHRGGGWQGDNADRADHVPAFGYKELGFRLARTLPSEECIPESHAHYRCEAGDVYWFDSCWNREELKEECGDARCLDGECRRDPGLIWVRIPEGTVWMGCSPNDTNCRPEEKPRHSVAMAAFEMTQTEITQDQYFVMTGQRPGQFPFCGGDCPVEMVTWFDAKAFCEAVGGRLPSEAEWEYATRAGATARYLCGNNSSCLDGIAWYDVNSCGRPHPVGGREPNAFGLYDTLGNVAEWVRDCWHDNYDGAPSTGEAWVDGPCTMRVVRGGSWGTNDWGLRVSGRGPVSRDDKNSHTGIRCARDIPVSDGDAADGDEG